MRLAALLIVVTCLSFTGCASGTNGFARNTAPSYAGPAHAAPGHAGPAQTAFAPQKTSAEVLPDHAFFQINRSGSLQPVAVQYTIGPTGSQSSTPTAGADFNESDLDGSPLSGMLLIPFGHVTGRVVISAIDDWLSKRQGNRWYIGAASLTGFGSDPRCLFNRRLQSHVRNGRGT